jgi:hypothetical protein
MPKDEFSSGHRDDQCWAKLYAKTREELQGKIDSYFGSYPTFGYNTKVDVINEMDGYYCAHMSRWHSCD